MAKGPIDLARLLGIKEEDIKLYIPPELLKRNYNYRQLGEEERKKLVSKIHQMNRTQDFPARDKEAFEATFNYVLVTCPHKGYHFLS